MQASLQKLLLLLWHRPRLLLMLWSLPLLLAGFFNLEQQSLVAYDEGLYASRARLMIETGDWVHPWTALHHKTPGPYWLLALSMQLLGRHEVAVRLPSVLASLVCVLLTYEVGRRLLSTSAALWGALSLSVAFLWLQYSRFATPDIVFTAGSLGGILCLLLAETSGRWRSHLLRFLAGLFLGLGFLMRSFLGALPMVCLLPYLVLGQRRHRHLSHLSLYAGFLVGLLPTLGWLYLTQQRFGSDIFLSLLAFPRRLGLEASQSGGHPLFYLLNLLLNDFPWIFFAIAGLYQIFFSPASRALSPVDPACAGQSSLSRSHRWLLAYPLFYIAVLSLAATRMPHYALPAYPFLALLAGAAMAQFTLSSKRWLRTLLRLVNALILLLGSLLAVVGLIILTTTLLPIDRAVALPYALIGLCLGLGWLLTGNLEPLRSQRQAWLAGLLLSNWLALLAAGATYQLGNANPALKAFLLRPDVQTVLSTEPVNFSPELGPKTGTLLRFYTPLLGQRLPSLAGDLPVGYLWLLADDTAQIPANYHSLGQVQSVELIQILETP
ncbi:MAG: phospholipid carrier-dependent glycosyltransferase [Leptolyngbya sp. SIO4C1]|nr:phospholipid carrier-dependent glycosyltransferase [Leptolyngbya sp. SIO4C1]